MNKMVQPKKMSGPRKVAFAVALAFLGAVGVIQIGYKAGQAASEEAQERLSVLWPSVRALPVDDRTIVIKAAMACGAHQLPAGAAAAEVATCLRAGAREYDGRHDDQPPIAARLEQLLRAAAEKGDKTPAPAVGTLA